MGQLERYGLYVLCLVIFLILGVAIWGSDPQELRTSRGLSSGHNQAAVKSQDDHRNELDEFFATQDRESVAKQRSAEAVFRKAEDPGVKEAGSSNSQVPDLPIKRVEAPPSAPARMVQHTIAEGDSFSSLAQHYLGKAEYHGRIAAANPRLNPRRLKLGVVVKIPPRGSRARKLPAGSTASTHRVRDGESPWRIAAKYVGSAKADRYSEQIMKLNGIVDAKRIKAGDVLKLPSR